MRNYQRCLAILPAVLGVLLITPLATAQTQSVTRVVATGGAPAVPTFYVDGSPYAQTAAFLWPKGSTHILSMNPATQTDPASQAQYSFTAWTWHGVDSTGAAASGSFSQPT